MVEEAEAALSALGSTWEWLENDELRTVTAALPAIRPDLGPNRSNSTSFFNSIVAAYTGWNDSRNKGGEAVITADGAFLDPQFMLVRYLSSCLVCIPQPCAS